MTYISEAINDSLVESDIVEDLYNQFLEVESYLQEGKIHPSEARNYIRELQESYKDDLLVDVMDGGEFPYLKRACTIVLPIQEAFLKK